MTIRGVPGINLIIPGIENVKLKQTRLNYDEVTTHCIVVVFDIVLDIPLKVVLKLSLKFS